MRSAGLLLAWAALLAAQQARDAELRVGNAALRYVYSAPPEDAAPRPLAVILAEGDPQPAWRQWTATFPPDWLVVALPVSGLHDGEVKAVQMAIRDAATRLPVDGSRVYLAGASTAGVFYTLARIPDEFAAGLAIEGTPVPAINTNKLYAAGTSTTPLLWLDPPAYTAKAQAKLKAAGFRFETASRWTRDQVLEWLSQRRRPAAPFQIDCETHSLAFARCFWLEIVNVNPRRRNDAVPPTRVKPGSGAALAIGPFGYRPDDPGPGVEVVWLPDQYSGPLRLKDRIIAVAGADIKNGQAYADFMDEWIEPKLTAVTVQRGDERLRLETAITLPARESTVTARVQGQWLPESRELLLITRAVSELRLQLPRDWAPAKALWNGNELSLDQDGCWLLTEKEGALAARPCPAAAP